MNKFVTATTLTAGLGASLIATGGQDAQAAEYNYSNNYNYNYNYDTNTQNNGQYNYNYQANQMSSFDYTGQQSQVHTTNVSTTTGSGMTSAGNLYTAGQCTWYVYDKVGGDIGSTWGNANNWASAAASAGYTVDNTPEAGSILQTGEGAFGHVAYVEDVNEDGSVTVSEMNYSGGPFSVSTRTISADEAASYNYIHI